jgi:hypothetical protein
MINRARAVGDPGTFSGRAFQRRKTQRPSILSSPP